MDRLAAAEGDRTFGGSRQPMAATLEVGTGLFGEARLDRDLESARPLEARRIEGRLRVLTMVADPREDLEMPLRLHEAAHDAEGHEPRRRRCRGIGGRRQRRNDRVIGTLCRRDRVGMPRLEMEARASILHRDPPLGNHHARTEPRVVALDERAAASFAIGGAEEDRAAGLGDARIEGLRHRRIDPRRELAQAIVRKQLRGGSIDKARVGDMAMGVGEAELHRFDREVQDVRAIRIESCEIEVAKHAECHQRREPLPVRRNLVKPRTAVLDRDRLDFERLMRREIACPQEPAFGSGGPLDRLRDLASMERFAFGRRDRLEGARVPGKLHELARRGRLAAEEKRLAPIRAARKRRRRAAPKRCSLRAEEIPLLREANRRREQFGERKPPMPAPEIDPQRDLSRHRHRQPAPRRHAVEPGERRDVERLGTASRSVEAPHASAIPQERKRVAAESVRRRLDDGHARRGRNRRVGGRAALGEDRQPRACRDRHAGGDDLAPEDRLALRWIGQRPAERDAHETDSAGTPRRIVTPSRRATSSRCGAWRRRSPPPRSKARRAPP